MGASVASNTGPDLPSISGRQRRPADFAGPVDLARDPQDQRLFKSRRDDLHADRQSVPRQTSRCGRRRQADQSDEISGRNLVDIVFKAAAVDAVGEILLDRIGLHRRRRRQQNVEALEQLLETQEHLMPRALCRGEVDGV